MADFVLGHRSEIDLVKFCFKTRRNPLGFTINNGRKI